MYAGHRYLMAQLDSDDEQAIQFVQREPLHSPLAGVQNQEVLRVLIDRVKVLHAEKPWTGNERILFHLRMALTLHELRALEYKVSKGKLEPELVAVDADGHFMLCTETPEVEATRQGQSSAPDLAKSQAE